MVRQEVVGTVHPLVVRNRELSFAPLGVDGAPGAELAEALGADRSSTLGAGFARFEECRFPWTLAYDELVYVIGGEVRVRSEGELLTATAGDVLFLPNGSTVEYEFPGACSLFFVTYPVNWAAAIEEAVDA